MRKLLILMAFVFLVMTISVSNVVALELNPFANKKTFEKNIKQEMPQFIKEDFNEKYGSIRLSKSFLWMESDRIAEYTLTQNTEKCIINCEAEGKVILYQDGAIFEDAKFKNLEKTKEVPIKSYEYLIFDGYEDNYVRVPDKYKEVCEIVETNSTLKKNKEVCREEIESYKMENQPTEKWKTYNGEKLKAGNYRWKIKGVKSPGQSVDFIPIINGVEFDEWAEWTYSLNNDLVSYYNLNETTGTLAVDSLGTNNGTASASGVLTSINGIIGSGADLTAGTEDIEITDNTLAGNFTVNMWVNQESLSTNQFFISKWTTTADGVWGVGIDTDTNMYFYMRDGGTFRNVNIGGGITLGTWNMLTISYNSTAMVFYLNGEGGQTNHVGQLDTLAQPITIGSRRLDSRFFDGVIDEVGIWSRALEKNEIEDLATGISYVADTPIAVTLNSPGDNIKLFGSNVTFSSSLYTSTGGNLTNATLQIWKDGLIEEQSTDSTISGLTNTSTININLTSLDSGKHEWNIFACNSDGDCNYAESNRSFVKTNSNATLYIWENDGTLINTSLNDYLEGFYNTLNITLVSPDDETQTINPAISFTYNYTTKEYSDELTIADIGEYKWNVLLQENNGTYINSTWGESNRTFKYGYEIESQSFNTTAYETDNEQFIFNITTSEDIINVDANLNYNGTVYPATTSCSGNSCILSADIDINLVSSGASEDKDFFFEAILFTGSDSFRTNLTSGTQTVNRIYLEECGTYTDKTLNFTAYEEGNLSRISAFDFFGTFEFWLGNGNTRRSVSFNNNSINEQTLCISPGNRTFRTDAQIEYGFSNTNITYTTRNYYFNDAQLTNNTQNTPLYLLNAEDSTSFIVEVLDISQQPIEGAFVYIQRYYPSTGEYKTVQILETDSNGKSIAFYKTETVDYKHLIVYNGETVLDQDKQKIFAEESPSKITLIVGTSAGIPWVELEENSSIISSLTFNDTTKEVTFSYIDTTGATAFGNLLVYRSKANETKYIVCNTSSSESSATLACDLSGYDDGYFIAEGYAGNPSKLVEIINFIISTVSDVMDKGGLFLGWLIILTVTLAFIWNPTAMVISHNIAVIFVSLMGLVTFSPLYIFSMIGISIFAIILLKT